MSNGKSWPAIFLSSDATLRELYPLAMGIRVVARRCDFISVAGL
jgi:hypothetical protein